MIDKPNELQGFTIELLAKQLLEVLKPELKKLIDESINDLRGEFKQEIGSLREEFTQRIENLRDELTQEFRSEFKQEIGSLRHEFTKEINNLREGFSQELSEVRSESNFYKKEREYLISRYGKIRTLEETLSARNVAAIFDEEGPIPHWKKL